MAMARREFIKQSAAAAAATVAGIPVVGYTQNIVTESEAAKLKWSKAPCRFCGTGCGVNVAVKDNQVVATHGDFNAEVNKGCPVSENGLLPGVEILPVSRWML